MKRILCAVLMMLLTVSALPALAQWATVRNQAEGDRLNLRARPSRSAVSLGKYYTGTRVQILEEDPSNGWCRVRIGLGNGIAEAEGYMQTQFLAFDALGEQVKDGRPMVVLGTAGGAEILLKSAPAGSTVGKAAGGSRATVLGVGETFLHVLCEDGQIGFVPASAAEPRLYFGARPVSESAGSWQMADSGAAPVLTRDGGLPWATVNKSRLNLRRHPGKDAQVLARYYAGTQVQILERDSGSGWTRVRVSLGNRVSEVEGYVMTRYLTFEGAPGQVADERPLRVLRSPDGGRVWLKNYTDGSKVGWVDSGQVVTVLGVTGSMLHVARGKETGFVSKLYAQEPEKTALDTGALAYVVNPDSSDRLQLRDKPDRRGSVLAKFQNGTRVEVLSSIPGEEYVGVRVAGMSGFMSRKFLSEVQPEPAFGRVSFVRTAQAYRILAVSGSGKFEPRDMVEVAGGTKAETMGIQVNGWILVRCRTQEGEETLWTPGMNLAGGLPQWDKGK